ncbi:MAG TPA: phospholipase D-like domain-containing protein, partial [Bdellovibrionales bacterium]|nr:phospholipase D-like domain-containing protein [Bdellovibrionales bacterium]
MKNLGFLFAIAMWTNTPARADQVQYLAHAPQALAAFMDMADGARKSVDIATFIFEPCHSSTQLMLEKLAEKARQGVRVRLIVDALQQKSAREKILSDYAARAGLRIKYYNRGEANLRLHIKMMVVDNERYISGGRNISDEYFGLSQENNYVDRDLRVEGASALQATAVFEELWASKTSAEGTGVARRFPGWQTACAKEAKPAVGIEAVRE